MANVSSKEPVADAVTAVAAASVRPGIGGWRGTRVALLCGATAILLLGVAAAGVFGYLTIVR